MGVHAKFSMAMTGKKRIVEYFVPFVKHFLSVSSFAQPNLSVLHSSPQKTKLFLNNSHYFSQDIRIFFIQNISKLRHEKQKSVQEGGGRPKKMENTFPGIICPHWLSAINYHCGLVKRICILGLCKNTGYVSDSHFLLVSLSDCSKGEDFFFSGQFH